MNNSPNIYIKTISYLLFFQILFTIEAFAQDKFQINSLEKFLKERNIYGRTLINKINNFKVVSNAESDSTDDKTQTLDFYIIGLHKKSCRTFLRKAGQYEEYKNFFNYVEQSSYNDKTQRIYMKIESQLLPVPMILDFQIARIKKPGIYPFTLDKGMFNGLKGKIHVYDYNKQCLAFGEGHWKGKHTSFPDIVIELFSSTLLKLGLEKLFRITNF